MFFFGGRAPCTMASWNWSENNNGAVENDTTWSLSTTALDAVPQNSNFSSQWRFSPNAAASIWPQTYDAPFSTSPRAFRSHPAAADASMSFFDDDFADTAVWEDWDAWGDIENKGNHRSDGLERLDSQLEGQHIWTGFAAGISPQESNISNPMPYTPNVGSSERAPRVSCRATRLAQRAKSLPFATEKRVTGPEKR